MQLLPSLKSLRRSPIGVIGLWQLAGLTGRTDWGLGLKDSGKAYAALSQGNTYLPDTRDGGVSQKIFILFLHRGAV